MKLVYRRDADFSWGYFRPAGVIDVRAGVHGAGRLISWEFENWNSGASGLATPFRLAKMRELFQAAD